ncbi:MAG: hypothetical protein AAF597_10520 [Bacteroidota bacterium]
MKSTFFALSMLFVSSFSFAGNEVMPAGIVEINTPVPACTLDATFTSGDTSVSVSVTAADCGSAASTLAAIADALDQ